MARTLIQLIFEHALRIRLKADINTSDEKMTDQSRPTSPAETLTVPDDDAPDRSDSRAETEATLAEGQSSAPKANSAAAPKDQGAAVKSAKDSSMIGKINNMVTTDVNTLENAYSFFLISAYRLDWSSGEGSTCCERSLVHAAADRRKSRVSVHDLGLEVRLAHLL